MRHTLLYVLHECSTQSDVFERKGQGKSHYKFNVIQKEKKRIAMAELLELDINGDVDRVQFVYTQRGKQLLHYKRNLFNLNKT